MGWFSRRAAPGGPLSSWEHKAVVQRMLGIEHPMTWAELFESIPPAYTKYIGSIAAEVVK